MISAPKIRNVKINSIFSNSCGLFKLENLHIELYSCFLPKILMKWEIVQKYYRELLLMSQGLSAKILTLDVDTIKVTSCFLVYLNDIICILRFPILF